MKKKLLILSLVFVFSITLMVGINEKPVQAAEYELPEEVKIGVIGYDFTGGVNKAYHDYLLELADAIEGLSFQFVTTPTNAEAHISSADGLLTQEVDGIITVYDGGIETILDSCEDAGVYLAMYPGGTSEETYEKIKNHSAFSGIVYDGYEDGTILGEKLAQRIAEMEDVKNIGITSFPQTIMEGQAEVEKGFRETLTELKSDVTIYDTHEHFFDGSGIDMYVSRHAGNLDLILGMGAAFENDYPVLANMGLLGHIKLASVGMIFSDEVAQEFKQENVIWSNVSPPESAGTASALLINDILGQQYKDAPDYAPIIDTGLIMVANAEEYNAYRNETYIGGGSPMLTVDEFTGLLTCFNSDATFDELVKLNESFSLEKALEAARN